MRRNRKVEILSPLSLIEITVVFRNSIVYGNLYELKIQDTTNTRKMEE